MIVRTMPRLLRRGQGLRPFEKRKIKYQAIILPHKRPLPIALPRRLLLFEDLQDYMFREIRVVLWIPLLVYFLFYANYKCFKLNHK